MSSDVEVPPPQSDEPEVDLAPMSVVTMALFGLNVLAALALFYLLALDYGARQTWSYAVFRHDLALWGLPLSEADEAADTGWHATRPRQRLDAGQLKKDFEQRVPGAQVGEKFHSVYEVVGQRIKPSQLSQEVLHDIFQGLGKEVRTVKEEVERVQKILFDDVFAAARDVTAAARAKGKNEQVKVLKELLLPLATTPSQLDALEEQIAQIPADGLDAALQDAAQRRMLVDTLRLLEERRPSGAADDSESSRAAAARQAAYQAADPKAAKLEDIQERVRERFKQALEGGPGRDGRTSFEKRSAIAYLLFTISQMRKPANPPEPLYPQGPERTEAVVGVVEFALAADDLAEALRGEQARALDVLLADRDGSSYTRRDKDKKALTDEKGRPSRERLGGFVNRYQAAVGRLVEIAEEFKQQQGRRDRLKENRDDHENQLTKRVEEKKALVQRLLELRKETRAQVQLLRELEGEIFRAQVNLSDISATNERLLRQIREAERALRGLK
jgi:hypothetical protein